MKHTFLSGMLLAVFLIPAVFGQWIPGIEDSDTGGTFNSADEAMSGELTIDLPYDPSEDENIDIDDVFNSADDDIFNLYDATEVQTGPAMNIALICSALALAGLIVYRVRRKA